MATMTKKRSWKRAVLIAGVFVVAGLVIGYVKFRKDSAPQYQTVQVTRGDVIQVVTATGQLNPVTNVQVGCQISGTLDKLFVDYNSPVTNGQIVARLDPATYQAIFHQTEGDLANAEAALELAQVNARRSKEPFFEKAAPTANLPSVSAAPPVITNVREESLPS